MARQDMTVQGYTPPSNTQFSVFLDNRCGTLLELLEVFEGCPARLAALSVVESADCAIARLLATNADLLRQALHDKSLSFAESEVLVVRLPGDMMLNSLCRALLGAELNIHAAYPVMVGTAGASAIVLHCDDIHLAARILRAKRFDLLGEGDLAAGDIDDDSMEEIV